MDTSWWLALAGVMLLALVVTLVDGWGRSGRRPKGAAYSSERLAARPRPGEIWWLSAPVGDEACLVLSVRGDGARVIRITGERQGDGAGVIALPPGSVTGTPGTDFLDTRGTRMVPLAAFHHRAGVLDAAVWNRVRHLTN